MSRRTHWLAALAALLFSVATPQAARAFSGPICANITCGGTKTPTLSFNGVGLQHAVVVPLFVGSWWASNEALQAQMIGMTQGILNGPYVAALNQYGTSLNGPNRPGMARMVPAAPILVNPYNAMNQPDAIALIDNAIGSGALVAPVSGVDTLYVLFLPDDGTPVNPPASYNFGSSYQGAPYRAMWVRTGLTGSAAPGLGFTHELAESLASHVSLNCVDSSGASQGQVADVCECYTNNSFSLGQATAAYWSANDGKCVVPEGWQDLYQYSGTPGSWTRIYAGALRQVDAGPAGVILTDTSDNVYYYNGYPFSWSQIGGPGSMFAVGQLSIFGIGPNADYVAEYSGGGWYVIYNGYATSFATGVVDLVTDMSGFPLQRSGGSWNSIGTPANQYVVGDSWVAQINAHRTAVLLRGPNDSGWTQAGTGAASELFVGGHAMLMRRQLNGTGNLDVLGSNDVWSTPWQGAEDMAALYGNTYTYADAAVLSDNRATIYTDSGSVIAPYGGSRLVGGGQQLYTTFSYTY